MALPKTKSVLKKPVIKQEPEVEPEVAEEIPEEPEVEEAVAEVVAETAEAVEEVEEVEAEEVTETTGELVTTEQTSTAVAAVNSADIVKIPGQEGSLTASGRGNFDQKLAEDGFEGLEGNYFSFPHIKLDKGQFVTSDEEDLDSPFLCRLMNSKPKWAYTTDDEDDGAMFSFDQVHETSGDLLQPKIDEWEAEGKEIEVKIYTEVVAEIMDGDLEGEVVSMSVAPNSVPKLFGYTKKLEYKKLDKRKVITEVSVGKKVIPKVKSNSFYPWKFSLAKDQSLAEE